MLRWVDQMSEKTREDEWFQKFEEELIRDARRKRTEAAAGLHSKKQHELKSLHWMKCPKCGGDMASRQLLDITIDKCSQCEGVFFDRGELEGLLLKKKEEQKGVFRRLAGLVS